MVKRMINVIFNDLECEILPKQLETYEKYKNKLLEIKQILKKYNKNNKLKLKIKE